MTLRRKKAYPDPAGWLSILMVSPCTKGLSEMSFAYDMDGNPICFSPLVCVVARSPSIMPCAVRPEASPQFIIMNSVT